jgi:hypothetical protein
MNSFLDNLVVRRVDPVEALRPRLLTHFEPPSPLLPDALTEMPSETRPGRGPEMPEQPRTMPAIVHATAPLLAPATVRGQPDMGSEAARRPAARLSKESSATTLSHTSSEDPAADAVRLARADPQPVRTTGQVTAPRLAPRLSHSAPIPHPSSGLAQEAESKAQPRLPQKQLLQPQPVDQPRSSIASPIPDFLSGVAKQAESKAQPLLPQSQPADQPMPSITQQRFDGSGSRLTSPDAPEAAAVTQVEAQSEVAQTIMMRPGTPPIVTVEQASGPEVGTSEARFPQAGTMRLTPALEPHAARPVLVPAQLPAGNLADTRLEKAPTTTPPLPGQLTVSPQWDKHLRERTQEIAARLAPHSPARSPEVQGPAPATIHVTIGRIEVRATPPPAPAKPQPRPAPPVMSLDEYLRQRASGGL